MRLGTYYRKELLSNLGIKTEKSEKFSMWAILMLIGFLPKTLKKNKIEYLHLSDALLSPIGSWLKKLTGVLVSTNVHGLDLTFDSNLYQTIIPFYLKKNRFNNL